MVAIAVIGASVLGALTLRFLSDDVICEHCLWSGDRMVVNNARSNVAADSSDRRALLGLSHDYVFVF